MTRPTERMALTLREAAAELGLTPQRVNQLLADGELEGPKYPGPRAPKNAKRVYADSLAAHLEASGAGGASAATTSLEVRVEELERLLQLGPSGDSAYQRELRSRERAARSAALYLKVVGDEMRAALEAEHQLTAELRTENERLRTLLAQAESRSVVDRRVNQALSETLTGFLTPDELDEL